MAGPPAAFFPFQTVSASPSARRVRRPAEVIAFESALVAFFVDAANPLGVPKSIAAIYGICFASPVPLGFAEIQARLKISAGSISQGIRLLRGIGALKPVMATAKRGERFEPDLELRKLITHYLEQRVEKQLKVGGARLAHLRKKIPGGQNGSARLLRARMKSLQAWHDKGRALVPVAKAFFA